MRRRKESRGAKMPEGHCADSERCCEVTFQPPDHLVNLEAKLMEHSKASCCLVPVGLTGRWAMQVLASICESSLLSSGVSGCARVDVYLRLRAFDRYDRAAER